MTSRARTVVAHPLFGALVFGLATYLFLQTLDDIGILGFLSAKDNADAANNSPGITAIGAGGTFGATQFIKDLIDKTARFPLTSLKDMWDIASQPTDEAQADKALDVYWDMTGIKHAPPGSPGGDIKAAGERFLDFSKGKTDIP